MDSAVSHQNDKPVFYKRDLLFTHLVVDIIKYDVFGDKTEYTVYYAGTSKFFSRIHNFQFLDKSVFEYFTAIKEWKLDCINSILFLPPWQFITTFSVSR